MCGEEGMQTLRVTDTGQVGVHTDAPMAGLHVQGTLGAAFKVEPKVCLMLLCKRARQSWLWH